MVRTLNCDADFAIKRFMSVIICNIFTYATVRYMHYLYQYIIRKI